MMATMECDVLVVGGGPGGYAAAIRCGQLGLKTILVEASRVGGTCLNRGCIPSKALIHAAEQFRAVERASRDHPLGIGIPGLPSIDFGRTIQWKDGVVEKLAGGVAGLLRKAKVKVLDGWATFQDGKTCVVTGKAEQTTVSARHVIIATGSAPVEVPALKFGGAVISSDEALSLSAVPKRLVVVGAGYIGLELGIAFRKLGSELTVVEQRDRILPLYDDALTAPVAGWLARNNVTVHLGASARGMTDDGSALLIEKPGGETLSLPADKVLVAVGRRPLTQGWGIENLALDMDGPFIRVDERCSTSMKNVWAIGDVVGEPMLAHKATAQAEVVAEVIAGRKRRFDPIAIPGVCFTEPEIVSVGFLPSQLDAEHIVVSAFPFAANGRSLSMEAGEGFVRVTSDRTSRTILGVQAVGAGVSELAAAFSQAVEMQLSLDDLAGVIHAHPTLGEAFHEAALKGLGNPLHA